MSSTEKQTPYKVIDAGDGKFIKAWTRGVEVDPGAEDQLRRIARLPFIHKWVAVMPDAHVGKGATVSIRSAKAVPPVPSLRRRCCCAAMA